MVAAPQQYVSGSPQQRQPWQDWKGWRGKVVTYASQPSIYSLFRSFVLLIFLYGCQTWSFPGDAERKIKAFNTRCLRKLIRISYMERKPNEYVRSKFISLVSPLEPLLATVKRRTLAWFGHVPRYVSFPKTNRARWRADAVADVRRRVGSTTLWSGRPSQCQSS